MREWNGLWAGDGSRFSHDIVVRKVSPFGRVDFVRDRSSEACRAKARTKKVRKVGGQKKRRSRYVPGRLSDPLVALVVKPVRTSASNVSGSLAARPKSKTDPYAGKQRKRKVTVRGRLSLRCKAQGWRMN